MAVGASSISLEDKLPLNDRFQPTTDSVEGPNIENNTEGRSEAVMTYRVRESWNPVQFINRECRMRMPARLSEAKSQGCPDVNACCVGID
jgi:hypothetical protein